MNDNKIQLHRASLFEAEAIWRMQVKAFAPLLENYRDVETNPGNETLDRVKRRLAQRETFYYLILYGGEIVGAIRVYDPQDGHSRKRISPLFILPQYQGQGIAQAAIREAERIHGSKYWNLETVLQEAVNCHLYEKAGYRQTGERRVVNERMTLVTYEK